MARTIPPDGNCIREYVHVSDFAEAHVAGPRRLMSGPGDCCLETGTGFPVREVAATASTVTNREVAVTEGPHRPGDTACVRIWPGDGG